MKNILVTLFTFLAFQTAISANCPDNITFTSQAEVNAFPTTFPNCARIDGNVTISGSDITSLSGLSNLTFIGGALTIQDNPLLATLTGLNNLQEVGNRIIINNNAQLSDLNGLNNLMSVSQSLIISNNTNLSGITALSNLNEVGSDLVIENNKLSNLNGLQGITTVGSSVVIKNSIGLVNLQGLNNLHTIVRNLQISNNSHLLTLAGLNNLTFIGSIQGGSGVGSLIIEQNWQLQNITDLQSLGLIGSDLYISTNPVLDTCTTWGICNYINNPNGVITIQENTGVCRSLDELMLECENYVGVIEAKPDVYIFPNPVSDMLRIRYEGSSPAEAVLYDALGRVHLRQKINSQGATPDIILDMSHLPAGIYMLKIHSITQAVSRKIMKY